jgi:hypothetical protein
MPRLIVLTLLASIVPIPLLAQQVSVSCGLLQVAELESAIGGKATGAPKGSSETAGGMTIDDCAVVLSEAGVTHPVDVRLVTHVGMDGAQAITFRNQATASEPQWKTQGARLEQATIGKAVCILTGRPSVPSHALCSIPRGDGYLEVDVRGSVSDLPTLATVAGLAQKANSRL